MNKRFLELAKQLPGWVSTDDGAYIGPHSSALKLYAELIVRECAEVGLDSVEDGDDLDAIMKRVHNNILKHFGVAE
jgi:hypothetical protein